MSDSTYYLVFQFSDLLDKPSKEKFRNAFRSFGKTDDPQPYRITHGRQRLDGQAMLMVITLPNGSGKADFINILADELGVPRGQINAKTTFTKLPGTTTEERAQAARDYIIANKAAWEPAE